MQGMVPMVLLKPVIRSDLNIEIWEEHNIA